jgi:hypothetical protein
MNKLIISIIFFSGGPIPQANELFSRKISVINPNNNKQHGGPIDHNKKVINGSTSQWGHKIFKLLHHNWPIFLAIPIVGSAFFLVVGGLPSSRNNGSTINNWRNIPSGNSEVKHPKMLGSGGSAKIDVNGIQNPSTVLNLEDQQFSWINPSNPLNGKPENFGTAENPSKVLDDIPQNFSASGHPSTVLNLDNKKTIETPKNPINGGSPINSKSDISLAKDQWDLLNSLKFFDNGLAENYFKWTNDFHGSLKGLENQPLEKIIKTIVEDRINFIHYALIFWIHNQSNDGSNNAKIKQSLGAFSGQLKFFFNNCCHCLNKVPIEKRQKVLDETKIGQILLKDSDNLRNIFSDNEQKQVIDFKGLMELTPEEKSLTTTLKTIPQLHPMANSNCVKFSINFNEASESIEIHRIVFQFCRADGDGFCLYNSLNQDADYLNNTFQEILNRQADDWLKQKTISKIAEFLSNSYKEKFYDNSIIQAMDQPHNLFNELKLRYEFKVLFNQRDILLAQLKNQLGDKNTAFLMEIAEILEYQISDPVETMANPNDKIPKYYRMAIFQKAMEQRQQEIINQFPKMYDENPIEAHFNQVKKINDLGNFKPSEDLKNKFVAIKDQLSKEIISFFNGPWIQWQKQMEGNPNPTTKAFVDYINGLKNIWMQTKEINNGNFYKNFIKTMWDKKKKLFGDCGLIFDKMLPGIHVHTALFKENSWKIDIDWPRIFQLNMDFLQKKFNKTQLSSNELNESLFLCQHKGIHYDRRQVIQDEKFIISIDEPINKKS